MVLEMGRMAFNGSYLHVFLAGMFVGMILEVIYKFFHPHVSQYSCQQMIYQVLLQPPIK